MPEQTRLMKPMLDGGHASFTWITAGAGLICENKILTNSATRPYVFGSLALRGARQNRRALSVDRRSGTILLGRHLRGRWPSFGFGGAGRRVRPGRRNRRWRARRAGLGHRCRTTFFWNHAPGGGVPSTVHVLEHVDVIMVPLGSTCRTSVDCWRVICWTWAGKCCARLNSARRS